MIARSPHEGVSWELLIIVVSFGAACALGSIWLGAQSKQIEINSARLDRIEQRDIETRSIEARILERVSTVEALLKEHMGKTN